MNKILIVMLLLLPLTGAVIIEEVPFAPEPYCGDGICNGFETCYDCKIDCPVCEKKNCRQPDTFGAVVKGYAQTFNKSPLMNFGELVKILKSGQPCYNCFL